MTGERADLIRRIRAVLPTGWFPDDSPILEGVLAGLAQAWSWIYDALQYTTRQSRVRSASDLWLDIIAADFFSPRFHRSSRESDEHFRSRLLREFLRERTTRFGLINAITDLTGRAPLVFEPARCADTGAYGVRPTAMGGLGYNVAGGWGSLQLPFQCFVTVFRPHISGIANVSGWNCPGGGYRVGSLEYANIGLMEEQVSDEQIFQAVAEMLPVASFAWTRIVN